jgi:hypothetical protein
VAKQQTVHHAGIDRLARRHRWHIIEQEVFK